MKTLVQKLIYTFSLVFILSCSSDDVGNQGNASSNYFPLAENNNWTFFSQQLEEGEILSTGTNNFKLGATTNIDGIDYFPWIKNDFDASSSPKISQNNAVTYLSQSFNLSELGLESDEEIEVENFPILDENASANKVFYTYQISREIGEFLGDGSQPVTANVNIESKMIGKLSSLTLFNIIPNENYNDILHTKTSAFVDATTRIPEESFEFTAGPFNTKFTVVFLEQDLKFIKTSEVQSIDYYFSREIGPVKIDYDTKPSNITIETNYILKSTVNGNAVDWNVDFEKREARAENVSISFLTLPVITIKFEDLPPSFNDLADSLEEAQAEIDALKDSKTINELEAYELF